MLFFSRARILDDFAEKSRAVSRHQLQHGKSVYVVRLKTDFRSRQAFRAGLAVSSNGDELIGIGVTCNDKNEHDSYKRDYCGSERRYGFFHEGFLVFP